MSRRSLRRRPPRLQPRKRLLILCEGKITEPNYLNALRHAHRNRLIDVEVVPDCGVPKTVVEYAVERKKAAYREARRYSDQYRAYDEVWCVIDVDEHPRLAEAKQQARDNGIELAISNPCFELWILLHFQDQFAEQNRAVIQHACRAHMPDYNKHVNYEALQSRYEDAVSRAQRLELWQTERQNSGGNPSTKVHLLTETIRQLGKEFFLNSI